MWWKKVPYSLKAEEPETYVDEIEVAGNTAELLERLGAPIEVDEEVMEKVSRLLDILEENDDVTDVYTNIAE